MSGIATPLQDDELLERVRANRDVIDRWAFKMVGQPMDVMAMKDLVPRALATPPDELGRMLARVIDENDERVGPGFVQHLLSAIDVPDATMRRIIIAGGPALQGFRKAL
jgi:hypothetical protein